MELERKHLIEKNRLGLITAIVISASVSMLVALGLFNGFSLAAVIRIAIGIVVIITEIVLFGKFKDKEVYRHICAIGMIVIYIVTIVAGELPEMYAVVYPIAMIVMLFANMKLSISGCAVAIIGTIIYGFIVINKGNMTISELGVNLVFVISTCSIACLITRLQTRQEKESIAEVEHGADIQLLTSNKIVHLAEELNSRFVNAQEVSANLNASMKTSNESVSEIAMSTKMNAEAIEKQTSQTADIQMSINAVGEEAKNMEEISHRTHSSVQEGVELIEQLKMQATEVAKINIETKQTTQQLNESIRDVQEITDTILGISSQTNLLALNASIEAARAGEAGRGFAVVAEEIRKLSEDTRKATEEITNIISKLTEDAEVAANSMTLSAEYADKQNELISQTGDKLTSIKNETDILYNGVVQVSDSVANIVAANELIMDSITNLSATEEEVAASTETAMSLSDSSMDALKNMNSLLGDISRISEEMERVAKG